MPLANCRECGNQVADSARTCPSCGVKEPTADPRVVAKKAKHLNPWVAYPVFFFIVVFAWHYWCLPSVGQTAGQFIVKSVNPITNVVVLGAPAGNEYTQFGYLLGTPMVEANLRRRARENFDLWGMLFGYSVRIES